MKKFTKLLLALGGISAVGAGLAVGMVSNNVKTTELVKADTAVTVSESLSCSYQTQRLWMAIDPDLTWWTSDSAVSGIHVWGTGFDSFYGCEQYANNDESGRIYYYADVPLTINGFQFVRMNSGKTAVYNYTVNGTLGYTTKINYVHNATTGGNQNIDLATLPANSVNGNLAGKILEGFTTCSDSTLNGYRAANSFNDNVIAKMSTVELNTFNVFSLNDYSYSDYLSNSNSYSSTMTRSVTYTAADKWTAMQNMASKASGAFNSISKNSDSSSTLVLGGIAGIAVLAAGGYFFVRKKKSI